MFVPATVYKSSSLLSYISMIAISLAGLLLGFRFWKKNKQQLRQKNQSVYKQLLHNKFNYYKKLHPVRQKEFENRVTTFIEQKQFVSRDPEMLITDEMKVQIAACAIQLTFGLPPVYFSHFHTIILYPERYFSTIRQQYHSGEINMAGLIVLSWKDFVDGYEDQWDGRNLGLHEMAHALQFENLIRNEEFNFLSQRYLRQWEEVSALEIQKMVVTEATFLRRYAATDHYEFFAVCVEYFFEKPREFKQNMPGLYLIMSKLLNQDPALIV
ncbi:MAG: zinc-dependent peptidase [Hymenobacteraceae bacterium]|nr:zinc-dependent peptidase [Hymenobacteraceae bacterium]MDX5397957.1 zinc-dependent peptidase [Hymenobacteraceae bacterium]